MFVGSVAELLSCADRFHAKSAAIANAMAVSDCVGLNAYFLDCSELAFIFVLLLFYFQLSKRHWLDDEDQALSSLTRLHANGTSFNSSVGRLKRESRT
jgi:hypothetical protein